MVQFGCCLPGVSFVPQAEDNRSAADDPFNRLKNNLDMLSAHGYDFAELTVGTLMGLSEDEFQRWEEMIKTSPLTVPVLNSFIPAAIKLTGPDVNREAVEDYLEAALSRVKAIGGEVIIFGSGGARSYPEGFDPSTALQQISDFLRICSDTAVKHGITIAIEPLNRKESNILNSVGEALKLAEELNLPRIAVLADSYHMLEEQENLSVLSKVVASGRLAHVHIADRSRVFPGLLGDNEKGMDFRAFFHKLHEAGYDGRISAECKFDQFSVNSKRSLDYVKSLWASML